MDTVLIRADGGEEIGMGHLMRCVAFTEGCMGRSITPVLVTRNADELEQIRLPEQMDIEEVPEEATESDDLALTLDLYEDRCAGALVTDLFHKHYERNPEPYRSYLKQLDERVTPLVVFDDLFTIHPPADVAVSPGYGKERILSREDDDTTYLLGTDYFPFRTEFIEQRRRMEPASVDRVEEIVVTLGGNDQSNVLQTVCRAIDQLERTLNVHVISGIGPDRDWTEPFRTRSEKQWTFTRFCNRMARAFAQADLAITGGGLSKYETALLGVPSVILAQVEHQHELMMDFENTGTCVYAGRAGEIAVEELHETIQSLLFDPRRLKQMSRNGMNLLDGKGRERLLDEIERESSQTHLDRT